MNRTWIGFWAIGTLALSSCSKTLDGKEIERSISTDLSQRGRLSIQSLTCPKDIPLEQGQSFECVGQLEPEGEFYVVVTQQDNQGKVSWVVPSSWRLLNLSQLESEFQQKLQAQNQKILKVDCGGSYRPTQAGDSFECQLQRQQPPNQPTLKTANQASNLKPIKVQSGKNPPQSSTSDSIVVRVAPQGQVTWQQVRVIAAQPGKSATASRLSDPPPANPASSPPAPPSSAAESSPEIGVKDTSGWTQLAD
jgi:hypothetical protein